MKKNLLFVLSIIPPIVIVQFLTWNEIMWLRGLLIWYSLAFLVLTWISLKLNDDVTSSSSLPEIPEIEEKSYE